MLDRIEPKWHHLAVCLLAAALFLPFLGKVHLFDWDEINFAEAAREMLLTGNFTQVQINFQPFFEKPPLFIWMQALSMKIFAVSEYAARFPNAVCGVISLSYLFFLGKRLKEITFAWWWVLLYAGSFLPHFYFKSGIIDPWFNLFIFVAVTSLPIIAARQYEFEKLNRWAVIGGCSLGLAVLTKGPVAIILTGIVVGVMAIWKRQHLDWNRRLLSYFLISFLTVASSWFVLETIVNGPGFVLEFLNYQIRLFTTQDAGHGGPFFYHFVVLLLGCFPASTLLLSKPIQSTGYHFDDVFRKWMWVLLWVVLIVFSIVETKILHYSSLAYFPLTYLAAEKLKSWLGGQQPGKLVPGFLLGFGLLFGIILIMLPVAGKNLDVILPYIKDQFAVANLKADVHWSYVGCSIGFFYLLGVFGFWYFTKQQERSKAWLILLVINIMTIQHLMNSIVPKIEKITQGAAIEFYEEKAEEDCVVEVLGFKSYAHLFYTNKTLDPGEPILSQEELLSKPTNRKVYFAARMNKAEKFKNELGLKEIKRKNGFVFLEK